MRSLTSLIRRQRFDAVQIPASEIKRGMRVFNRDEFRWETVTDVWPVMWTPGMLMIRTTGSAFAHVAPFGRIVTVEVPR